MMRDKVRTENMKEMKRERERERERERQEAIDNISCNYKLRIAKLLTPLRGLTAIVSHTLSRMVACGHKAHNPKYKDFVKCGGMRVKIDVQIFKMRSFIHIFKLCLSRIYILYKIK